MEKNPPGQQNYKDLRVWQHGRELVKTIYLLTQKFPADERFGLTNQMRRAAVSVPSNISEGAGRQHPKDTIQFLVIARGSLYELETQCYLAFDLSFISADDLQYIEEKIVHCIQLVQGFIRYYRSLG
ncbi:four helix bundle protein [Hymenobacter rubripertinctus]|uniref:Four helix bundle protein n=1 Tax=Hymenobacter rubripertinctus TaxID=2029981 RepID=A0A418QTX4_9BACT|nr:four helix bundle protein [Hymenobacter rubripertinctus]RIY08614.1 four helix bundle protein [Hymenobacter rubripertinctus]